VKIFSVNPSEITVLWIRIIESGSRYGSGSSISSEFGSGLGSLKYLKSTPLILFSSLLIQTSVPELMSSMLPLRSVDRFVGRYSQNQGYPWLYSVQLQYPFFQNICILPRAPVPLWYIIRCFTVNPSLMFLRFHKRCIRQWLELQRSGNTCPICRTFVTRVSLFNIFSYETVCLFARFRIRPFIC
jgi:hypothetical protein